MERRKALRIAAGAIAAGGAGTIALATAFKPDIKEAAIPESIPGGEVNNDWNYIPLDPEATAELAYENYPDGSCMYGVFSSVVKQLANEFGEPYASFPTEMMKYGHGGIGGYGTTCGSLNGAAALIGLLVKDKSIQNILIADLFHWYEKAQLPQYTPSEPAFDYRPPTSVSGSVLCHASTTKWGKISGLKISSKERKERCRRMTADVAAYTVEMLNSYFSGTFVAYTMDNEEVRTCMTCHGSEGKLGNTSGQMTCSSCHTESLGHKVFGDVHYKLMGK